jgi:cardiolipin synthase A/B
LPPDAFLPEAREGTGGSGAEGSRAAFVTSNATSGLTDAERMTQVVLAAAKRRIWISNAYFIPSTALSEVLREKAKQGVDVRVLAAGRVHDWKTVRAGQRSTYEPLLEAGVRIFEYQPSMMHAKTILIDERLAVVGSTNLDPLSLKELDEGSLVVEDAKLVAKLGEDFVLDTSRSLEIRKEAWAKRGLFERWLPSLTALVGRFL